MRTTHATAEQVAKKNGVDDAAILSAKGDLLGIPTRSIKGQNIPFEVLRYIPEESAMHYHFIPIAVTNNVLDVGLVDPDNIEARDALTFIASKIKMPFKIYLISEQDFNEAFTLYKGLSGEVTRALSELETDIADVTIDEPKKRTCRRRK